MQSYTAFASDKKLGGGCSVAGKSGGATPSSACEAECTADNACVGFNYNSAGGNSGCYLVTGCVADDSLVDNTNDAVTAWNKVAGDGDVWSWETLGQWQAWAAAAWTGWCAMVPGEECSNTFIHELGHSA